MKGKVLIVDDDPKIGKLLKFKLAKAGFETEYFSSGQEALSKIHNIQPHIIISDIQMPEMDGYEFCELLRQDPRTVSIPFIFLSGKTDTSDQLEGLRLGANDYVCKPVKIDFLLERMEKVLERAAKARSYKSQADFSGNLSQMNMNDIMQIVESNFKSGELVLSSTVGKATGRVIFDKGNLINAQKDMLEGTEAFFDLMAFEDGLFEFFGKKTVGPKKISITNMAALLQGSRLLDEGKALYDKLPNLDVQLTAAPGEIPDKIEERAGQKCLEDILSLVMEQRTAREIINCGKMSRPRAATILSELMSEGLITTIEEKSEKGENADSGKKGDKLEFPGIGEWLLKALFNIRDRKLTGVLQMENRETKQSIYFQEGRLIHAFHGKVNGKKALFRIFADTGEKAKFHKQPVLVRKAVEEGLNDLLKEGSREVLQLKDIRRAGFNNTIQINEKNVGKIVKLKNRPGLADVLALIRQHEKLQDVIDASWMTDLRTYNHILTMVKLNVIEIEKN